MSQIRETDPRIPKTSTAWQLWHSDMFDRETLPSPQTRGMDIIQGLSELWLHTLKEAIQDNGSGSFSRFHLTWGNSALAQLHYELLQEGSRWQSSAIDWSGETRVLLGRVELMTGPEEWFPDLLEFSRTA